MSLSRCPVEGGSESEGSEERDTHLVQQEDGAPSLVVCTYALQTDTNHMVKLLLSLGACPQNSALGNALWEKRFYG